MRSANHAALVTLKLEGYTVEHVSKSQGPFKRLSGGVGRDARWIVSLGLSKEWSFRSPVEAVKYLIDGDQTFSYWWNR